jgi:hypothetical protein
VAEEGARTDTEVHMTSTMMMERTGMMNMPGLGNPMMGGATAPMATPNMLMVPRCKFKMEKCQGGMKVTCTCDDPAACSMVQNLCSMMAGGMCSCCCMMNGMVVCSCNLTMGMCKCEMTDKGVCVTCTSGDKTCCDMIQACCDCLTGMLKAGCTCCLMMNNTPVCCGTC